ncbi:MAG: hypothetical protein FWE33_06775 [Defluviitaleaceae bacterium]|nr:hypothetical protein [Defluviitaleaceae bacterium]
MKIRDFKRLAKRGMAVFLAFIMVFGYMPHIVFANEPIDFSVDFDSNLIPSGTTNDPSPTLGGAIADGTGQAHFSFRPNPNAPIGTIYRLSIPTHNSNTLRELEFEILPNGSAEVRYNATGNFSVNIGVAPGSSGVNFQPIGSGLGANGTPPDRYFPGAWADVNFENPETENYYIDWSNAFPTFGIGSGQGFSFRPAAAFDATSANMDVGDAISFLWENGIFHIVVGGMQRGFVYDFTLSSILGGAETLIDTQRVFLGFDYDSQPVARHRIAARDDSRVPSTFGAGADPLFTGRTALTPAFPGREGFPLGWTRWDLGLSHSANWLLHEFPINNWRNDWYPAGYMPHTPTAPNAAWDSAWDSALGTRTPPVRDNMLEFVIRVPQVWRTVGGTTGFFPQDIGDARIMFGNSTFSFYIADGISTPISFTIGDIFGTSPNFPSPIDPDVGHVHIVPTTVNPLFTTILVDGPNPFSLGASRMFQNSRLDLSISPPASAAHILHAVRTGMSLNHLHTFLEYDIVYEDGQFYARILPYAGVAGTYRVHADYYLPIGQQSTITINADATAEYIYIPLYVTTHTVALYHITFTPAIAGAVVSDIESQWIHITFTPDRRVLSSPTNFTVTENRPELRYILGEDGLAEFEVVASWGMSNFNVMRDYFNSFGLDASNEPLVKEIRFDHTINSRDYTEQRPATVLADVVTVMQWVDANTLRWRIESVTYRRYNATTDPNGFPAGLFPPMADFVNVDDAHPDYDASWENITSGNVTINVPLRFVADEEGAGARSPITFGSIYFLTSQLMRARPYGEGSVGLEDRNFESSHNHRSFVSVSRPDIRDFPPPYNLEVLVRDAMDAERLNGHFDAEFWVAYNEIMRYLDRTPFRDANHEFDVMFRFFIGSANAARPSDLTVADLARMTPEERTRRINAGDVSLIAHEADVDYSLRPNADFNWSLANFGLPVNQFNISDAFSAAIVAQYGPFSSQALNRLNTEFRTHLLRSGSGLTGLNPVNDSIEDWLYSQATASPDNALLTSAWAVIANGVRIENWASVEADVYNGVDGWANLAALNATIDLWAAAFGGFDFVEFLQAATYVTNQLEIWNDFDFSNMNIFSGTNNATDVPLASFNIHSYIKPFIRENFMHTDTATVTRLNNEFRAHLLRDGDGLRSAPPASLTPPSIAQWLRWHVPHGTPSNALLQSAWEVIVAGVPVDIAIWTEVEPLVWDAVNNAGWQTEIELNATIAAWRDAFRGFSYTEFLRPVSTLNSVPAHWFVIDTDYVDDLLHPLTVSVQDFIDNWLVLENMIYINAEHNVFGAVVNMSALNNAIYAHIRNTLGLETGETWWDWLQAEAQGSPSDDVLVAAWDAIAAAIMTGANNTWNNDLFEATPNPDFDPNVPRGGWANQAELTQTVNRLRAALTGFNLAPFLRDAFQTQPPVQPPVGSVGTHNLEVNAVNAPLQMMDMSPFIDELRSGPVVIEIPMINILEAIRLSPVDFLQRFGFEGLDRNWAYNIFVDSYIQFVDTSGGGRVPIISEQPPSKEYSMGTNLVSVTTRTIIVTPDPGEIIPQAPRDLRQEEVTLNSARISWLESPLPYAGVDENGNNVGRVEYEIVRMRGNQIMPENLLNNRSLTIDQFRDAMETVARGSFDASVRTNRANATTGTSGNFRWELIDGRVHLTNTNLVPNTLYFYYVRTVWITDGGATYSVWNNISVTTSIIEAPVNLIVIDGTSFDGTNNRPNINFDPTSQIVIQFDLRVGDNTPMPSGHGTIFDFRYQLRADGGMWGGILPTNGRLPTTVNPGGSGTRLIARAATQGRPGYYTFTYVITGLNSGTTYGIRVHTFDVVNSIAGSPFSEVYSAWSNIAATRTDTNQDHEDAIRDRDNLLDYLRDLLMEFLRRPYWVAQNSGNHFVAVYRPTMMNELLATNGILIRLADSEQAINVFYLPQELFLRIWDSGQGFVFARGDMEIVVPNRAINNIDSEPVLQTVQRMRDVRGVEDYYVRLTADVREQTTTVAGLPAAGQQVAVTVDLVETNTVVRQTDEEILRQLMHWIETDYFLTRVIPPRNIAFMAEIMQMVEQGIARQYQVRRLYEIQAILFAEMSAHVQTRLTQSYGRMMSFNFFSQPLAISVNNVGASEAIGGHQFAANQWVPQNMFQNGNTRTMHTQVPGRYAFSRQFLFLPGLNTLPNSDSLQALIVRHSLTDFLGEGVAFDINAPITLTAVQGVVARIGGATAVQNPQNWLTSRGYVAAVRGSISPAQTQEAVYLMMVLYEVRTGTNVSALRITNFNALNGVAGIDSRYRPFIQAAFELGIYNNNNMQPTAPMTTGEFLRMLSTLNGRIGL